MTKIVFVGIVVHRVKSLVMIEPLSSFYACFSRPEILMMLTSNIDTKNFPNCLRRISSPLPPEAQPRTTVIFTCVFTTTLPFYHLFEFVIFLHTSKTMARTKAAKQMNATPKKVRKKTKQDNSDRPHHRRSNRIKAQSKPKKRKKKRVLPEFISKNMPNLVVQSCAKSNCDTGMPMEDEGENLVDPLFAARKVINEVSGKNSSGEGTVIGSFNPTQKSVTDDASCGTNKNTKLTEMSTSCVNDAHKKKITDHDYSFDNFEALADVVLKMKLEIYSSSRNNRIGWTLLTYVLSAALFSCTYKNRKKDWENVNQMGRMRNEIAKHNSPEYQDMVTATNTLFEGLPDHIRFVSNSRHLGRELLKNDFYSQWSVFNTKIKKSGNAYYKDHEQFMTLFKELNIAPKTV